MSLALTKPDHWQDMFYVAVTAFSIFIETFYIALMFYQPKTTSLQTGFLKRLQLHSRIRTHSTLILILRRLSHPSATLPPLTQPRVRFINALQEPEMFNACILMTRRGCKCMQMYRRLRNLAVHYAKPSFVQIGNCS